MSEQETLGKDELLARIERGWNDFQAYLNTLTDEQLTRPTDAAGWTAKDHIIHLAVWEDGMHALLQGLSRHEYMGIDAATWQTGDYDQINAVIQQRYKDMPLAEAKRTFHDVHERLIGKLRTMTDEELHLPYRHYQPESTAERPVILWLSGNTYEHYAEHQPWIDAIVRG